MALMWLLRRVLTILCGEMVGKVDAEADKVWYRRQNRRRRALREQDNSIKY
jgi:hypothetical protein